MVETADVEKPYYSDKHWKSTALDSWNYNAHSGFIIMTACKLVHLTLVQDWSKHFITFIWKCQAHRKAVQ